MSDWDERYRRGEHATEEPSSLLVRAIENLRVGRALDIACGAGRHALFLAERGWQVVAVDSSEVGIEITRERARERGVRLRAVVADLERGEFQIEPEAYDLICDFYYLQRDLFPKIRAGVKMGGLAVCAIHMVDEREDVRPMNPDYLLQPDELLKFFPGWNVEHYHETKLEDEDPGQHHRRTAEIIARKK